MTDDYPTCEETYVTLRLYHDSADPADATAVLQLDPSDSQRVGESYERRGITRTYTLTGWFYSSEGHIESYDTSKHLDWLLQQLHTRQQALDSLRSNGWRMDIACLWDSHAGHGGPNLSPAILRGLAELGIEVWFDIYFHGAFHGIQHSKQANATQAIT